MTVLEYVEEYETESGLGVALVEVKNGRIVSPYIGRWDCNCDDDQLEQLEVDENEGRTLDGKYDLVRHSGCYEEMFWNQESKVNDIK